MRGYAAEAAMPPPVRRLRGVFAPRSTELPFDGSTKGGRLVFKLTAAME